SRYETRCCFPIKLGYGYSALVVNYELHQVNAGNQGARVGLACTFDDYCGRLHIRLSGCMHDDMCKHGQRRLCQAENTARFFWRGMVSLDPTIDWIFIE